MNYFTYREGSLYAENVAVRAIAAAHGTPCYIYSRSALEDAFMEYRQALEGAKHLICYAVKANSNLAVLSILAKLGAGFDIVSGGELERVVAAGGDPSKVVFSGVSKKPEEMARALELGIHCFNLESAAELEVLNNVAGQRGQIAPISIRVNPDVDAKTHPYISTGLRENKFGLTIDEALRVYQHAAQLDNVQIVGLDCHIGSQLTEVSPFIDALHRLLELVDTLAGAGHRHSPSGSGRRTGRTLPRRGAALHRASTSVRIREVLGDRNVQLMFEPGRSIAANAGVLVMQVEYLKSTPDHHFALVDTAMNDMLRPALYEAWMDIQRVEKNAEGQCAQWDVVGPRV